MHNAADFRRRLLARELLIGTYLKTPSPVIAEVMGLSGLDVVCLDAEHAPFDRVSLDACVHALRSANTPVVIRMEDNTPVQVMQALDYGAYGVIAAHVNTVEAAQKLVHSAYFGPGGRGYAGSTRAAGYTTVPISEHVARSQASTSVIAQIEDLSALDVLDGIAAVEGLDCLFVGRVDLTVDSGATQVQDARVMEAVAQICRAGQRAGKAVGMFLPRMEELPHWIELGASFFLMESDHSLMLKGANKLRADFAKAASPVTKVVTKSGAPPKTGGDTT
ncbi:MAG: HpcH/HpaI aldolase family protein [Gammaproteobacteria bacterium]